MASNENQSSKTLAVNAIKTQIVKASKTSIEQNSKGDKVTWLRLDELVKDNNQFIVTSKNNTEYAAIAPKVDIQASLLWLMDNQEMENVNEWFESLFTAINRPILALAGASGFQDAELIGDIESLIAYETLQSARGRKASKFDIENWKAYAPVLSLCLKKFFEEKKIENTAPLVNKYLHLIKGAIVHFSPIGDDGTMDKASAMIEYCFEYVIVEKPELENLAAFAVTVMENNKKKYSVDAESEY